MFEALKAQYSMGEDSSNNVLSSALGFELELRPSQIKLPMGSKSEDVNAPADAGMGVFVKSSGDPSIPVICPGTVLAIFPGLVHLNEPLPFTSPTKGAMSLSSLFDFNRTIGVKDEYIHRELLPDPNYQLLMRLDGIFIDSRRPCTSAEALPNPYALAHLINHPPVDVGSVVGSVAGSNAGPERAHAPNVVQVRCTRAVFV
jgi:hypothetical protein